MPELSVIIINWNSVNYLRRCLSSIFTGTSIDNLEIIVVDNASFDGSDGLVENEFPGVKFISLVNNIGFARANNLAFMYTTSDFILFLNPDTEIIDFAIDKMLAFLKLSSNAGAVGCRLLNSDLSLQESCVQAFPNLINQTLDTIFLTRLRLKLLGIEDAICNNKDPRKVDVISGACIMVKRKVFEKVGLFSQEYFMFGEDVDLCYKIKKAGYNRYFLNQVKIIHYGGKSSENMDDYFYTVLKMRESRVLFFKKTKGALYAKCYQILNVLVSIIRLMIILSFFPFFKYFKRIINLKFSLLKWFNIFLWSLGLREIKDNRCNISKLDKFKLQ